MIEGFCCYICCLIMCDLASLRVTAASVIRSRVFFIEKHLYRHYIAIWNIFLCFNRHKSSKITFRDPYTEGSENIFSGLRPGLTNRVPVRESVSRTPLPVSLLSLDLLRLQIVRRPSLFLKLIPRPCQGGYATIVSLTKTQYRTTFRYLGLMIYWQIALKERFGELLTWPIASYRPGCILMT